MKKNDQTEGKAKTLFEYMIENKKWWLIPFFAVVIFFAILIIFDGKNSVMPLIYALL